MSIPLSFSPSSRRALPYSRHPDESRDPDFPHLYRLKAWVPAYAGMTNYCLELYSYIND